MKENEKELFELLADLHIDQEQAGQIAREIHQGEELLSRADAEIKDTAVLERLEGRIREELESIAILKQRKNRWLWGYRAAVAAAVVMITLVGVKLWFGQSSSPVTPAANSAQEGYTLQDELAMWDMSLTAENDTDMAMDDLLMAEVLALWEEIDWEAENIFGGVLNHENSIIETTTIMGIGTRCV